MKIRKEFERFMESSNSVPPKSVTNAIMQAVEKDLNPSFQQVLPKFLIVHSSAAFLTLLVCPQFGIGPLCGGEGIAHIFMKVGMWACALFCGFLFMGFGALISSLVISSSELLVIRKKSMLLVPSLSGAYLIFLLMASYAVHGHHLFFESTFVVFWMIGSIMISRLVLSSVTVYRVQKSIK